MSARTLLALKGPPHIAQGETLGIRMKKRAKPGALIISPSFRTPLQGLPPLLEQTQGRSSGEPSLQPWAILGRPVGAAKERASII
jgi:hypothetical protein